MKKYIFPILLLSGLFLLASCSVPKKVSSKETPDNKEFKTKVYDPATGQYKYEDETKAKTSTPPKSEEKTTKVTSKKDSLPPSTTDPIPPKSGIKSRIAVVLPFMTHLNTEDAKISPKSDWALQFYSGFKLGVATLEKEGFDITIDVFDDQSTEAELQKIIANENLKKADAIIGTVAKANVKLLASFAQSNRIPLISPYLSSDDVAPENPYLLQLTPSLQTHCEAIVQDIKKNFSKPNVLLICRNKALEMEALETLKANLGESVSIQELVLNENTALKEKIDLSSFWAVGKQNVIIIPSWSSEPFVIAMLRKIDALNKNQLSAVYGMPQWIKFDQLDSDLLERLKTRITASQYNKNESKEQVEFINAFFSKYQSLPDNEAFQGYDVGKYFVRQVAAYGKGFLNALPASTSGLSGKYAFRQNTPSASAFQNKSVIILHSKEGFFSSEQ